MLVGSPLCHVGRPHRESVRSHVPLCVSVVSAVPSEICSLTDSDAQLEGRTRLEAACPLPLLPSVSTALAVAPSPCGGVPLPSLVPSPRPTI